MALGSFAAPPDKRFFEDYEPGQAYDLGATTVSEQQIVDFAREFDPQDFHVDQERAARTQYGGIIASGWHTVALAMQLYVRHYLSPASSMGSPGAEAILWPNPLRPGDTMRIHVTILQARPSRSKPDRGIVRTRVEAINQRDEQVLSMVVVSILRRRPAA